MLIPKYLFRHSICERYVLYSYFVLLCSEPIILITSTNLIPRIRDKYICIRAVSLWRNLTWLSEVKWEIENTSKKSQQTCGKGLVYLVLNLFMSHTFIFLYVNLLKSAFFPHFFPQSEFLHHKFVTLKLNPSVLKHFL